MSKIKPIIGKKRLMVNHEGTKEVLTNVYEFKDMNEIRIDFEEQCVKILTKDNKNYEVVFEHADKVQLNNFHRFLITSMSGITQEEIIKARELAQQSTPKPMPKPKAKTKK